MISPEDITKLSVAERLTLIGELWDSMSGADTPVSQAQHDELIRRLISVEEDKKHSVSWESLTKTEQG